MWDPEGGKPDADRPRREEEVKAAAIIGLAIENKATKVAVCCYDASAFFFLSEL